MLEDFSGHEPRELIRARVPVLKKGLVLGVMDGVLYTATRDGEAERYIHEFKPKSRPLLAVSHDGKQLGIVGGRYQVTEAGIEDR